MLTRIIFLITFFILSTPAIYACKCGSAETSLDRAVQNSGVVALLRIASFDGDGPKSENPFLNRWVQMIVEKVYKGPVKTGDKLWFSSGPDTVCIARFDGGNIGKQLLFYGSMPSAGASGTWVANRCGRTSYAKAAAEDIAILDRIDPAAGKMRVTGRVHGPDGKGIARARVALIPSDIDQARRRKPFTWVDTDADGRYELATDIPGTYILMVNEGGSVTPREPYKRHYYSGGKNEPIPGIDVKLTNGANVSGIDIRIGKVYETVTVSGRALYADGEPIGPDAALHFSIQHPDMFNSSRGPLVLDKNGNFSILAFKGGSVYITPTYFYACCRVTTCDRGYTDKATAARPARFLTNAATGTIEPDKDITNLELRLPFKNCGKAKK